MSVVAGAKGDLGNRIAVVIDSRKGHLVITTTDCAKNIDMSHMALDVQNAGQDLQGAGPTARWAHITGGLGDSSLNGLCNAHRETEADNTIDT